MSAIWTLAWTKLATAGVLGQAITDKLLLPMLPRPRRHAGQKLEIWAELAACKTLANMAVAALRASERSAGSPSDRREKQAALLIATSDSCSCRPQAAQALDRSSRQ